MADLTAEILATARVRVAWGTSLAQQITAPTLADHEDQAAREERRTDRGESKARGRWVPNLSSTSPNRGAGPS
jgi:hypothetical protein